VLAVVLFMVWRRLRPPPLEGQVLVLRDAHGHERVPLAAESGLELRGAQGEVRLRLGLEMDDGNGLTLCDSEGLVRLRILAGTDSMPLYRTLRCAGRCPRQHGAG
jgi:hypothetical protein